ncbi:MAG: PQQ-binding-like beta-propeller repeat protein [Saprospiraceae bacterium]|nr:PQQ-binding-like beta-propeller repeat protein [Saprospiraceae bacterium]
MKSSCNFRFGFKVPAFVLLIISILVLLAIGCSKDDPDAKDKTPEWVYKTGENAYQSKPCITGNKVIVCSYHDTDDKLHTTHCIDKNSGAVIWTKNDGQTTRISPVVYNDLVILGGANPHALDLNNGNLKWKYTDDLVPISIYSNPLLNVSNVYFASLLSITKHNAVNGNLVWETEGIYMNLRNSKIVHQSGRLYFGDINGKLTCLNESNGAIVNTREFEGPFANSPLTTASEIFIGIQDADINSKTLRCLNLSDLSIKWEVNIGPVVSDMAISENKLYAIGAQTLFCRSASDGSEIWKYSMTAGAVCEPLVVDDKLIIGNGDGLYCFDKLNGKLKWKYQVPGQIQYGFSSPTLDNDKIIVCCSDGNVYCFKIN